jgi:polar amino acid transport system permease protein
MRSALIMRRVVLPQAFRIALPPYCNTLVMMLKDSSLASTITVAEMTRAGPVDRIVDVSEHDGFTLVALLYLALSLPLVYGCAASKRGSASRGNDDQGRLDS